MAVGMTITISGPLFKKGDEIVTKVTERFVQRMMEVGEHRLRIVLRPRDTKPGVFLTRAQARSRGTVPSQGDYREGIRGTPQGLRAIIDDSDSLYGPWLEGGGGRFKGYAAFRKTSQWLEKQVDKEAKAFEKHYVRGLGG
jgi:hypothetical protein